MDFVKLSALVGSTFVITTNQGFKYKMWDSANNKMLVSKTPKKGYFKDFALETNKGLLNLRSGQLGSIFAECLDGLTASLENKTIEVNSNGKTGVDIRYFFNVKVSKEEINIEDVPF